MVGIFSQCILTSNHHFNNFYNFICTIQFYLSITTLELKKKKNLKKRFIHPSKMTVPT